LRSCSSAYFFCWSEISLSFLFSQNLSQLINAYFLTSSTNSSMFYTLTELSSHSSSISECFCWLSITSLASLYPFKSSLMCSLLVFFFFFNSWSSSCFYALSVKSSWYSLSFCWRSSYNNSRIWSVLKKNSLISSMSSTWVRSLSFLNKNFSFSSSFSFNVSSSNPLEVFSVSIRLRWGFSENLCGLGGFLTYESLLRLLSSCISLLN